MYKLHDWLGSCLIIGALCSNNSQAQTLQPTANLRSPSIETSNPRARHYEEHKPQIRPAITTGYHQQISQISTPATLEALQLTMHEDQDADLYFESWQLTAQLNNIPSTNTVYARVYLREPGSSYQYAFTSKPVSVDSGTGEIHIESTELSLQPNNFYDLAIDIYATDTQQLIASSDADHDTTLASVALESSKQIQSHDSGILASIDLLTDRDHDGFYQAYAININAEIADDIYGYAIIYSRREHGTWQHEYTSNDFLLLSHTSADTLIIEGQLETGYPTDYYDFKIELFDEYDHFITSTDSDSPWLTAVPLEDAHADTWHSSHQHHHDDEYAGSMNISLLLGLGGCALWRLRRQSRTCI